jgi:HK97 gp10 family phage protein
MTTRVKFDTKGISEALEALARQSADVDAGAMCGLQAGGQVLVEGMQSRVAVDTGDLKDHIKMTQIYRDGNRFYLYVGVIGADKRLARKANAQEYGTTRMPAHPYIRPTKDQDMGKARRAMINAIRGGA